MISGAHVPCPLSARWEALSVLCPAHMLTEQGLVLTGTLRTRYVAMNRFAYLEPNPTQK